MKKNLTVLTGIVIAILLAGSCKSPVGKKVAEFDSDKVDIYLKAIKINGIVHLEMYDSKKDTCKVIDNLLTVVSPGYTVKWFLVKESNIHEVLAINLIGAPSDFKVSEDKMDVSSVFKLEIPIGAEPGTIKYEIEFTTEWNSDTTLIDPYLRIED